MRVERSQHSIPSEAGGHPSSASRAGFEARHRPLRCVGEASFASALATDVAPLLDVDPEIDRWRCRVPMGDAGLVADFETWGSRGREFLIVATPGTSPLAPSQRELPPNAKVVGPDDVDPVRLENARAILPYARWRVTLDDRVRLLAALDEEGSVTLADCLGILRHTSRPVATVAALALARVVELDLNEPLGSRTRFIRRQTQPSAPHPFFRVRPHRGRRMECYVMAIFVAPNGAPHNLHDELEHLRGVVADMEALARGKHPGRSLLVGAPILDGWALGSRMTSCLTGRVMGHPILGSGRLAMTSDLWVLAPSHGYARTLSRVYRLGRPYAGDGRNDQ